MLLLGVGAAVTGTGYKFGSLARMGPGFMQVVLGVVLAIMGILIAVTALGSVEPHPHREEVPARQPAMVRLGLHPGGPDPVHHLRNLWRDDSCGIRLCVRLCA